MMKFKYFILLLMTIFVCSCSHYKDIPYFQNSAEFDGSKGAMLYDMKIKLKDNLSIFVFCPSDPETALQFRARNIPVIDYSRHPILAGATSREIRYFNVENDGCIEYPLVGKIHLEGLTIEQANAHIKEKIAPYFNKDTEYLVNVYMRNYNVTVMGEVNNPNTFEISRNKVTVLEALAMAGDMTIYGKRDNVKILRELPDGTYEVHELDMRDANILNSPYYYLQQRDIVYVEPNEAMAQNAKIGRTTQLWVRGASITISLGSLLYRVLQ
ncbi:polysaccharide biosynthesis/export family protein [Prevotella sp. E2-28]|uniref:polysaccharide biosynthesis/export family protein n=1 Tax=Prevotella sp. E2-28 TaxID=2913620 RepID=UPI001EDC84FD|nr:polysaccharide biosynthesis/export family protein [Prevotella sp. E2-28]UKK54760.1 polysaccharide biosynthesis/export family protein [Prevotella sp. E2-28]